MNIAIVGASCERSKFGNKAVRAYLDNGDRVFPINPFEERIEGIVVHKRVSDVGEHLDVVSLYVPPTVGILLIPELVSVHVPVVYLNPGAESNELILALKREGIEPRLACSILAIGKNPGDYQ